MKRKPGNRLISLPGLIVTLALSGCTGLGPLPGETSASGVPGTVLHSDRVPRLIRYFNTLAVLSSAQLNYEHERAEQAFLENPSFGNRIRLASLLSYPNTSFRDYDRALKLLQPCQSGQTCGDSKKNFALFLSHIIVEWKMQREQIKQMRGQIESLNKKLNAIKSIEKSINERENSQILHVK